MQNNTSIEFFLAANSGEGFYSKFSENFNSEWSTYIIKGGAGTGKSSLMKKFAATSKEKGLDTILCPCSSDPQSLDAVILPQKKIIILDGTAPHIVEPKIPGACEEIINTGLFWNSNVLKENKAKIIDIMVKNKAEHKKASAYITTLGKLKKMNFSFALSCLDLNSCFDFAAAMARRHIKTNGQRSCEWERFLGGITPNGYVFYRGTLQNIAKKRVILRDEYGAAASVILSVIRDYALKKKHEIITVKNPILPSDITDAVIIPELSLAFAREETEPLLTDTKKHNIHRFYDEAYLKTAKEKMKFNKKACSSLLSAATDALKKAKESHDELEKIYGEAMDYAALNEFTDRFLNNVFE